MRATRRRCQASSLKASTLDGLGISYILKYVWTSGGTSGISSMQLHTASALPRRSGSYKLQATRIPAQGRREVAGLGARTRRSSVASRLPRRGRRENLRHSRASIDGEGESPLSEKTTKMKKKAVITRRPPASELELRELDREFVADTFRPLTPAERKTWRRMRRKRGRPQRGKGAKVISVSVERELLRRADHLAKCSGLTRARLIELGLRTLLRVAGAKAPA